MIVIASRIPPRPLEAWRLEARCLRSHEKILALFWRLWAGDHGGVLGGPGTGPGGCCRVLRGPEGVLEGPGEVLERSQGVLRGPGRPWRGVLRHLGESQGGP